MTDKEPTDERKRAVGVLFADYRDRARITQAELAARVGGGKDAVGKWEAGKNLPHTETLLRVRRELGIPIEALEAALGIEPKTPAAPTDGIDREAIAQDVLELVTSRLLAAPHADAIPSRPTDAQRDPRSRRRGE